MENFKWCVWLVPDEDHPWNSLTNGFPVHLTVKSHLEKEQAETIIRQIDFQPLYLTLVGSPIADHKRDFKALYYRVEPINLNWFPDNPHVSFRYCYDREWYPYLNEIKGSALFNRIVLADCRDHFTKWTVH